MTNPTQEQDYLHKNISLNTQFFLTSKGEDYFAKNRIPIRDIMTDKGKKSGFSWNKYELGIIQKFIISEFIKSIEIEQEEIMSKSSEIFDLTLSVFYSTLFKKFKPELSSFLFNSEIMNKIKIANPTFLIYQDFKFNEKVVNDYLAKNADAIEALKEILAIDAFAIINNEEEIQDKEQKKKIITYFIEQIEPGMWFVFYLLNKTGDNIKLLEGINALLIKYLNKSKLADLIAFSFTEFIQNAENTHFKRLARMKKIGFGEDISEIIQRSDIKARLAEHARNTKAFIKISYIIYDDLVSSGSSKLEFVIKNKGDLTKEKTEADEENALGIDAEYLKKVCSDEKISLRLTSGFQDKTEESVTVFTFLI